MGKRVTIEDVPPSAKEAEGLPLGYEPEVPRDGHAGAEMTEARADELPIERSRSGVIGLLVGLSAGYGLSLVRGRAA